jgi:hypothetical protein
MQSSQVRLFALLARKSSSAVVFRRGPSRSVLLTRWNTSNDTFEHGQWLKGRIYERRCDLSPEGDLLLYFAANHRKPHYSWSAVSRPPYLSALAMWPKGDGWGGGGHFTSSRRIALNHRSNELKLAEGFSVPKWMKIEQFGQRPGWGEDEPVWSARLERDGWKLVDFPNTTKDDFGAKVMIEYSPPVRWRKLNPKWPKRYSLDMSIIGMGERDGPWYLMEHTVNSGDRVDSLGRSDWADWSESGDLLFAMNGSLYRGVCSAGILAPLEEAIQVADFSRLQFEAREPSPQARRWPSR